MAISKESLEIIIKVLAKEAAKDVEELTDQVRGLEDAVKSKDKAVKRSAKIAKESADSVAQSLEKELQSRQKFQKEMDALTYSQRERENKAKQQAIDTAKRQEQRATDAAKKKRQQYIDWEIKSQEKEQREYDKIRARKIDMDAKAAEAAAKAAAKAVPKDTGLFATLSKAAAPLVALHSGFILLSTAVSGFANAASRALAPAKELQTWMAKISTVMSDAERSAINLKSELLGLQAKTGMKMSEVGASYYDVLASGAVKAADATEFLGVAAKLARGGMTTLDSATKVLRSTVSAYGLEAKDAAEISDALFIAARDGATDVADLSREMGSAVGVASMLGVSYKELVAFASAITTTGVTTSEAFTAINSAMISLSRQTDEMTAKLQEMGIYSIQAEIAQNGLVNTLRKVTKASGGSAEAVVNLMGRLEAVKAVSAATAESTGKKFDEMYRKIRDASANIGKSTEEANEIMLGTLDEQIKKFFTELEVMVTDKTSWIADTFAKMLGVITKQMEEFNANAAFLDKLDPMDVAKRFGSHGWNIAGYMAARNFANHMIKSMESTGFEKEIYDIIHAPFKAPIDIELRYFQNPAGGEAAPPLRQVPVSGGIAPRDTDASLKERYPVDQTETNQGLVRQLKQMEEANKRLKVQIGERVAGELYASKVTYNARIEELDGIKKLLKAHEGYKGARKKILDDAYKYAKEVRNLDYADAAIKAREAKNKLMQEFADLRGDIDVSIKLKYEEELAKWNKALKSGIISNQALIEYKLLADKKMNVEINVENLDKVKKLMTSSGAIAGSVVSDFESTLTKSLGEIKDAIDSISTSFSDGIQDMHLAMPNLEVPPAPNQTAKRTGLEDTMGPVSGMNAAFAELDRMVENTGLLIDELSNKGLIDADTQISEINKVWNTAKSYMEKARAFLHGLIGDESALFDSQDIDAFTKKITYLHTLLNSLTRKERVIKMRLELSKMTDSFFNEKHMASSLAEIKKATDAAIKKIKELREEDFINEKEYSDQVNNIMDTAKKGLDALSPGWEEGVRKLQEWEDTYNRIKVIQLPVPGGGTIPVFGTGETEAAAKGETVPAKPILTPEQEQARKANIELDFNVKSGAPAIEKAVGQAGQIIQNGLSSVIPLVMSKVFNPSIAKQYATQFSVEFTDDFLKTFDQLGDGWNKTITKMGKSFNGFSISFGEGITSLAKGVGSVFGGAFNLVSAGLRKLGNLLAAGMAHLAANANLWAAVFQFFNKDSKEFKKMIWDTINDLFQALPRIAENIPTLLVSLLGYLPDMLSAIIQKLPELVINIVSGLIIGIQNIVTGLLNPDFWGDMLSGFLDSLGMALQIFAGSIANVIMKPLNMVLDFVGNIIKVIVSVVLAPINLLRKLIGKDAIKVQMPKANLSLNKKAKESYKSAADRWKVGPDDGSSGAEGAAGATGAQEKAARYKAVGGSEFRVKDYEGVIAAQDPLERAFRLAADTFDEKSEDFGDALGEAEMSFFDGVGSMLESGIEKMGEWGEAIWDGFISMVNPSTLFSWGNKMGSAIINAFTWSYNSLLKPFTSLLVQSFQWAYNAFLLPFVSAISTTFQFIYSNILLPVISMFTTTFQWVFDAIFMPVLGLFTTTFQWIFDTFLMPVINLWVSTWQWIFDTILMPVINLWVSTWQWIFDTFLMPFAAALGTTFQWINDTLLAPFLSGVVTTFQWVGSIFTPVIDAFRGTFQWVANLLSPIAGTFKSAFQWIYDAVIKPFENAIAAVGGVVKSATSAVTSITNPTGSGGILTKAGNAIASGAKSVSKFLGFAEGGMVPAIKHLPSFADGGVVSGSALYAGDNQKNDRIMAMLSPGEFVIPRTTVSNMLQNGTGQGGGTVQNISVTISVAAGTSLSDGTLKREVVPKIVDELRKMSQNGAQILSKRGVY